MKSGGSAGDSTPRDCLKAAWVMHRSGSLSQRLSGPLAKQRRLAGNFRLHLEEKVGTQVGDFRPSIWS